MPLNPNALSPSNATTSRSPFPSFPPPSISLPPPPSSPSGATAAATAYPNPTPMVPQVAASSRERGVNWGRTVLPMSMVLAPSEQSRVVMEGGSAASLSRTTRREQWKLRGWTS
ncbi:unnamed protein product [Closterium sp. NIES-53]